MRIEYGVGRPAHERYLCALQLTHVIWLRAGSHVQNPA